MLLISPWNFPIGLCFRPLVSILAAGNCCLIKPSEVSPHSAKAVQELVERYLPSDAVRVVQGAVDETTALLTLRFDHIFYTGNGFVARIVMKAAAQHLTPTTLELGGKSPCFVDSTAKLGLAAKRIVLSKFCWYVDNVPSRARVQRFYTHILLASSVSPRRPPPFFFLLLLCFLHNRK